jgi:hypothetical protein
MSSSVVLPGSGPLSRSVCYTRAAGSVPTAVTVVARDEARAAEPAYVGNARAALTWSRAVPGAGPTAPPHAVLAVLTAEVVAQTHRARPLAARDSAALLIRSLLTDAEIRTKVPGGYPVRTAEDIQLDLPAGLTAADAVAWNRAAARLLALRARPRGRADP